MNDQIDPTKLAADFVVANLDRIVDTFGSLFSLTRNHLRTHLDQTYREYLSRVLNRYGKTKSFFVRSEPLFLYDFYVPLDLSTQRRTLTMPGPSDIAEVSQRAIITGSGGAGKSLFMRHLLIRSVQSGHKVPIFLELRHLNTDSDTIMDYLLHALQIHGLSVQSDYALLALAAGHFCILLDGFDELPSRRRDPVAREIQDIAERYPKNWLILSSREDSTLEGWPAFIKFRLDPLSKERAISLVRKLPFDDPIKTRFVEDLRSLYGMHHSFLSNPLLLSIMVLTYSDNAEIPIKLSLFYNQAYESLFQRHDALKGGFKRERKTGLDIQDFAKVFAAFSLQSYDKRKLSFSRADAIQYCNTAKNIV
jgi:predicted NACHT family NTPase